MTRELAALAPRVRAEAELAVVQLAVAIARRVLHREISTNPAALLGVVKSACERLNARELSRLRAAPLDASLLQEHRAAIVLKAQEPSDLGILKPQAMPFSLRHYRLDGSHEDSE